MPEILMRPATPRPVPGPSTTRLAPGTAAPPPICSRCSEPERSDGQRLRLKIIDDDDFRKAKHRHHHLGPDHPRAIGQFDFIAADRPGNGKNCGSSARLDIWARSHRGWRCRCWQNRRCGHCQTRRTAIDDRISANRALVPPISPTRTGNSNAMHCSYAIAPAA